MLEEFDLAVGEHEGARRDKERQQTKGAAAAEIGAMSDRELFFSGVGLYWAEGSKDKPYDRRESVIFVNSDPGMIKVYLAWLDLLGVERERMRYAVMIHESADASAGADLYRRIEGWWSGMVVEAERRTA